MKKNTEYDKKKWVFIEHNSKPNQQYHIKLTE